MATIAPPSPATLEQGKKQGGGFRQSDFGGDSPRGGGDATLPDRRYHTGMMIALAAIIMFFFAFTSAYVVRKGISGDWRPIGMPGIVWFNTVLLVVSSFTLEKARRYGRESARFVNWWLITTVLGVLFLLGQLIAWRQLAATGIYVNTNPSSSFFYLLTGAHGVHLLGGLSVLLYILLKAWQRWGPVNPVALDVTALYWHSMDGLWLYLFCLFLLWG